MRLAILFALGLAVGAIAAVNIASVLGQRDAYPRGLMNVMQHDFGVLRERARTNRCDARETAALGQLHSLSEDLETAVYEADPPEAPFAEYAQRLRSALPVTVDCRALARDMEKVGAACDACHRQYR